MTRRTFLELVGQVAGGTAVHGAMRTLQLTPEGTALAFTPRGHAPPGTRVIVIGAGLTGLTVAYELQKLGYDCRIFEARPRIGGRCFTIRGGTVSEEANTPRQTAAFDDGLYLNAGPARIPHHHAATLAYCRELGVAVEMFCSVNEAAYVHRSNGDPATRRLRLRELKADWRGHTSEILAKASSSDALDLPMSHDDRDRLVEWLQHEGGLDTGLHYAGTSRRGYRTPRGAGDHPGVVDDPLGLADLVRSGFNEHLTTSLQLQMPMFQAVGGMDQIARALAARVRHVTLSAEALSVEQPPGGVRLRYRDAEGDTQQIDGRFCVCAVPLSVLRAVRLDVSPALRSAITAVPYSTAGKMGLQFKRRFWEEDEGIYGGITKTDLDITQILYPSDGFLSRKGVLVGYYHHGPAAAAMGALPPSERLARALEQGAQIHPQYRTEFETAFSVAWQNVPYSRGGWARYSDAQRRNEYQTLLQPDRNIYLAGDHLTYLSGWMAGAFESARSVVVTLHERASRDASTTAARYHP